MSRPASKPSGGTPRSSFRLPSLAREKLDDLVSEFTGESSQVRSRTSILIELIDREHARRSRAKGK